MNHQIPEETPPIELWRRVILQAFNEIIKKTKEIFADVEMTRTEKYHSTQFGDLVIDDYKNVLFNNGNITILINTQEKTVYWKKEWTEQSINSMESIDEAMEVFAKLQMPLAALSRYVDQLWMIVGSAVRREATETLAKSYQFN